MNNMEQTCAECGLQVAEHHLSLSRRIDVMSMQEMDGKTVRSIQVLANDFLLDFCDHDCWSSNEPAVIAAFDLKTTYPSFHWIAECSACGSPVNRTKPYVSLNVCELIIESQPWLATARVLDDKEFAVLCNACDAPEEAKNIEQESKADEVPMPQTARNADALRHATGELEGEVVLGAGEPASTSAVARAVLGRARHPRPPS